MNRQPPRGGMLVETGRLPIWRAFFKRLRQLGYVEGQNLAVERYSGEGRMEQFAELAHEVVRGKPGVVFVTNNQLARDVKTANDSIPVVAMLGNPVADGTVPSLARPGGNITGTAIDAGPLYGKSLETLKEMLPSASRVGWLTSRQTWEGPYAIPIREAAQSINVTLIGPPLDVPLVGTARARACGGVGVGAGRGRRLRARDAHCARAVSAGRAAPHLFSRRAAPPAARAREIAQSAHPELKVASRFGDVKQMTSGCWTNEPNCAGYATVGNYGFAVKCSIWWNNGANGRLNMRFKAGESYDFYVRYNDMCVCVPNEYPLTERRFYCWVR